MKTFAISAALGALALAQPAFAQDGAMEEIDPDAPTEIVTEPDGDASGGEEDMDPAALAMISSMFAAMFQADPLTPEAEARLPEATAVAASLVPEGVYGEMMGQMMESFLSPILEMAESDGGGMSAGDLAEYTGLYGEDLDRLSPEERVELTQMFDPVYETRSRAQFDMILSTANTAFAALEPGVRDGLAKAYASRFESGELVALNAFFATPVGAKYARQSLVINTDPQVISGMMQSIPSMLQELPVLLEGIEEAEAGLPEPRRYDDLTPSEQRRASEILGVDQMTLRQSMADVDAMTDAAAADAEANVDAMAEIAADEAEMAAEEFEAGEEEREEEPESFEDAMEDLGEAPGAQ
ncbi:DUF2059 domain-containing protein [Alteriqipengyuania lutimaris]|uniref:DUF2059 domain-containing protein n=1 Tax=Alteriqipengyuania lutimaris TaxID=1538146 RepID=A0A395LI33_9SPHN|nr:DUF2059 domain-containing protein [Alteriqipengyuania lutimaris]MBB3034493.1 hypothetical protein [Alteriqipengyuania lutimaris]RDS76616.1 DUF2059 domain-containing protein [Alteriqipengyuania lutimaris]